MSHILKNRRRLTLLGFVVLLVVGLYFLGATNAFSPLLGTWESDNLRATIQTTFNWNGTYEQVVNDDIVFRGRYSATKTSFRLYDFQRYLRNNGTDTLFVPCRDSLECVGENEINNLDEEMAMKGYLYNIKKANWRTGNIVISSRPFSSRSATTEVWTRQ